MADVLQGCILSPNECAVGYLEGGSLDHSVDNGNRGRITGVQFDNNNIRLAFNRTPWLRRATMGTHSEHKFKQFAESI